MAYRLREEGHDTIHPLNLPYRNRTADERINDLSAQDLRAVITKDTDFVNSFLLFNRPYKLLLIATGNIANADLENLFVAQIPAITAAFDSYDYLELTRATLVFHS